MACFYKDGLKFDCIRCSKCCRHVAGYVYLSKSDIVKAASHLALKEDDFLNQYCRTVQHGTETRISLTEKPNYDCIFWDEKQDGCSIYQARPLQCQSYPFWEHILTQQNWKEEAHSCPGINKGTLYTKEDISSILEKRIVDPLIVLKSITEEK